MTAAQNSGCVVVGVMPATKNGGRPSRRLSLESTAVAAPDVRTSDNGVVAGPVGAVLKGGVTAVEQLRHGAELGLAVEVQLAGPRARALPTRPCCGESGR